MPRDKKSTLLILFACLSANIHASMRSRYFEYPSPESTSTKSTHTLPQCFESHGLFRVEADPEEFSLKSPESVVTSRKGRFKFSPHPQRKIESPLFTENRKRRLSEENNDVEAEEMKELKDIAFPAPTSVDITNQNNIPRNHGQFSERRCSQNSNKSSDSKSDLEETGAKATGIGLSSPQSTRIGSPSPSSTGIVIPSNSPVPEFPGSIIRRSFTHNNLFSLSPHNGNIDDSILCSSSSTRPANFSPPVLGDPCYSELVEALNFENFGF